MMPMLNNRNKITGESYDQALLWVTLILLAFGMVLAVDRGPLLGYLPGSKPKPETEKMGGHRV